MNCMKTEVDLAQVTSLRIQVEQLKQSISQLEAERAREGEVLLLGERGHWDLRAREGEALLRCDQVRVSKEQVAGRTGDSERRAIDGAQTKQ
jgi:hypothetical protein